MPFILLIEVKPMASRLGLVKLYMDLLQVRLGEASERTNSLLEAGKCPKLVAEADLPAAAHFVYQAGRFGFICQLRQVMPAVAQAGNLTRIT